MTEFRIMSSRRGLRKGLYRLYAGHSDLVDKLSRLYKELNIELGVMRTPLEAEARNISLYVHPALFMNDFSLSAIFDESGSRKYVYKLFPEGPITQVLIRSMLSQWKEMMNILNQLGMKGINLSQFMTDDNYPVRNESLSRQDIDSFDQLQAIHQEYLLYIRYASLLIDPFLNLMEMESTLISRLFRSGVCLSIRKAPGYPENA